MEAATVDIKEEAHRIVDQLPSGATWDDVLNLIYVHQQIREGIKALDEGRFVTAEELRRNLGLTP